MRLSQQHVNAKNARTMRFVIRYPCWATWGNATVSDEGPEPFPSASVEPRGFRIGGAGDILKLAAAAALLLVALAVAYHFLVYIPKRDADRVAAAATAQSASRASAQAAVQHRRDAYQSCVQLATNNYVVDWNLNCERLSKQNVASRTSCYALQYMTAQQCENTYPVVSVAECSLPHSISSTLKRDLEDAKVRCTTEAEKDLTN